MKYLRIDFNFCPSIFIWTDCRHGIWVLLGSWLVDPCPLGLPHQVTILLFPFQLFQILIVSSCKSSLSTQWVLPGKKLLHRSRTNFFTSLPHLKRILWILYASWRKLTFPFFQGLERSRLLHIPPITCFSSFGNICRLRPKKIPFSVKK